MLRTLRCALVVAASTSTLACSASLRRGVTTTDAATGLLQITRSRGEELDPAVSPDATRIAFEATATPGGSPRIEAMGLKDAGADAGALQVYDGPGMAGRQPAWVPDGSGLVFLAAAPGGERLVQTLGSGPASTGSLVDAGNRFLPGTWPAVAPSGHIAMSVPRVELFRTGWRRDVFFDSAIGVSDVSGSGLTFLGAGMGPAWSPHGYRLAFSRQSGGHAHVFVASADGSDAVQITDGTDDDIEPAWAPDGKALAFCSGRVAEDGTTHSNIFTVNPDGSELRQLTEGDRSACRPAWGRDGFIYFHADAAGAFHIWRVRPVEEAGTG